MKEYMNLINGTWVRSDSGKTFENTNPANQELVGTFQLSTARDIDAAVEAAAEAYKSWRLVPAPRRAEYLYKIGELLRNRKEELARIETQES